MSEGAQRRESTRISVYDTDAANDGAVTQSNLEAIKPQARPDQSYDDARRRGQLFDLLRKERQLKKDLDTSWFFRKAGIQSQLDMVQRDLSRYRTRYPDLAMLTLRDAVVNPAVRQADQAHKANQVRQLSPADDAQRKELLGKIMATERADVAVTLRDREQQQAGTRADRLKELERRPNLPFDQVFNSLRQLIQNPPRWYQSKDQWLDQCQPLEKDLVKHTQEPSKALFYWTKKLDILEDNNIRPGFFGKARWEEERKIAQDQIRRLQQVLKAKSSE